jgi:hypothetical protein
MIDLAVFFSLTRPKKKTLKTLLPSILGHAPAGTSTKNMIQFVQGFNAKKFQHYDYGKAENVEHYGTPTPPEYDVTKVTTPVVTFWGDNDWLAMPAVNTQPFDV